jgi:tetratricopeptide (TPR) repeat protein
VIVKRAGVKMDGGNYEEAMNLFDVALGLDPNAADALLHRANLYMLLQKSTEAKADLDRCLQLRPDHLLARLRLATVLMATNDLEGAKKALDMAEEVDPESSEVHSYRGEMRFATGDFVEARREFDKAVECDPSNATPYVNAALAVMNTPTAGTGIPDAPEAIRLLERAIEVDPQFHAAYVHLGQLKLSMATNLTAAREVLILYDKGLEHCRTPEEIKDICGMRILTLAQVDAASMLGMETFGMQ